MKEKDIYLSGNYIFIIVVKLNENNEYKENNSYNVYMHLKGVQIEKITFVYGFALVCALQNATQKASKQQVCTMYILCFVTVLSGDGDRPNYERDMLHATKSANQLKLIY